MLAAMEKKDPTKHPKPELPYGTTAVKVGQLIRRGDLRWDAVAKTWREIVDAKNITVLPTRDGWYCRRG